MKQVTLYHPVVMLQPFRVEPEPDYNCKDKFLVQTILVSDPSVQEKPINDLVRK